MAGFLTTVADQVLADFNAAFKLGRISLPIVAARRLAPDFKARELAIGTNRVLISPISMKTKRNSKTTINVRTLIDIGVVSRVADGEPASTDPVQELFEDLSLYHFNFGLGSNGALGVWVENEVLQFGDPAIVKSDGVMFALWTSTFEATVERLTSHN
jgi:hypothetical protein